MSAESKLFKAISQRHGLVLAKQVPLDDSAISHASLLSIAGAEDNYLAHGAIEHCDQVVALRSLKLRIPGGGYAYLKIFVTAVSHEGPGHFVLLSPGAIDSPLKPVIEHAFKAVDSLPYHHRLYVPSRQQSLSDSRVKLLAENLPAGVNLEQLDSQLLIFTLAIPDSGQAEHLLRLARQLA